MNKQSDDHWKLMKKLAPEVEQSNRMRNRIRSSIRTKPVTKVKNKLFEVKSFVLTALFLFISAGLLFQLQNHDQTDERTVQSSVNRYSFTWDLEKVYSKKRVNGYDFFEEGESDPVGFSESVTVTEKEKIINSRPMNTAKEMENFPYPTMLYIEHVKMMDVSLRYHFFVDIGQQTMHFSFDYPRLEYADIFQIIASLDFKKTIPYKHESQLYVTHGYGFLPYPVGLTPVEISGNTEKYHWKQGGVESYKEYLEKIKSSGQWKQKNAEGSFQIFESANGLEIVKIAIKEKEITYLYSYPNRED